MMSREPWATDRKLTAERAREAIATRFPELRPVDLRWLGRGWDHDVYLANDEWVFRFPRRAEVVASLERELAALPAIAAELEGLPVRLPRYRKIGRPGPFFPYRFAGYRLLPGVPGSELPVERVDRERLARELGELFSSLHATAPERVAQAELPDEDEGPADWLAEVVGNADHVAALLPEDLAATAEPWLRGEVEPPPPYAGPPRLIHNDVDSGHLLLDPTSGGLASMIDFGDLAFGDPMIDWTGLYCWLGAGFVERLLDHYRLPIDGGHHERLVFFARTHALDWLGDVHRQGATEAPAMHVAWIRNAFA